MNVWRNPYYDYIKSGRIMTEAEKELIEAALVVDDDLRCREWTGAAPGRIVEFKAPLGKLAAFADAAAKVREERQPKLRYTTRPTGFGEAVWDTRERNFVPPSFCAKLLNDVTVNSATD